MKINIQTKYTKMSFEMTAENANKLIAEAVSYAQAYRRGQDKGIPEEPEIEEEPIVKSFPIIEEQLKREVPKPFISKPVVQSRVERVFGEKSTWESHIGPGRSSDEKPYKGFLHIRCEKCGKDMSYMARIPTYDHRCTCGHHTPLKDLKPAHVNCSCGGSFTYMTNIKDDGFTMSCLNCGSRAELVLNGRETAYVTFGRPGYAR